MTSRVTCVTRAGGLARDQYDKDITLFRNRARVAERLTGVIKAAAAGNDRGVRYWREWLKEAGWRRLVQAHEDGHPDPMVGTDNWTIRIRARWRGRAPERETRELLGKVMKEAAKWTRDPLRSWASRRGGDWREGGEERLI